MAFSVFLIFLLIRIGDSLLCHQCEGWRGHKDGGNENSCLKYNNNCETNVFCVKITEPMTKEATYEPYRSECWHQNNLVVGPGNSTTVQNECYTFFDQATPPKRWTYCFCNSSNYCNTGHSTFQTFKLFSLILTMLF
ncbi:Protein quiver [Caenorhabditis elegans]|uniref:Protein quiver n=1 Tax=Caenorhabditis elegans TaxID=6239 RepID=Q20041_CAEEL|nr:Protein quiver [Caenorhabditis elegans]CCD70528.1 Protein quiver [Caenorhabditis elegans]|eukprot:NP_494818.1 Uncharacterized protein CELE_F35D11.1 [Caenorhabditis elegans]